MGKGREEIRRQHVEAAETTLGDAWATASKTDARLLERIQRTEAWLTVLPSTINETELGGHEWRDSLFLRYGIESLDLQSNCNGCGAALLIYHDLDCRKRGLITAHNNDLRDGVANLSGKAFTPAHVHDDPNIFTGCTVCGGKTKAKGEGKGVTPPEGGEEKGDLLIR